MSPTASRRGRPGHPPPRPPLPAFLLWFISLLDQSYGEITGVAGIPIWKQVVKRSESPGAHTPLMASAAAARCLKEEPVIQKIPASGRTGGFMLSAVLNKNERQTVSSKGMKATGKPCSRITPNCH